MNENEYYNKLITLLSEMAKNINKTKMIDVVDEIVKRFGEEDFEAFYKQLWKMKEEGIVEIENVEENGKNVPYLVFSSKILNAVNVFNIVIRKNIEKEVIEEIPDFSDLNLDGNLFIGKVVEKRVKLDLINALASYFSTKYKVKAIYKMSKNEEEFVGLYSFNGKYFINVEERAKSFLALFTKLRLRNLSNLELVKEFMYRLRYENRHFVRIEEMLISFNNIVFNWFGNSKENMILSHCEDNFVIHHIDYNLNFDYIFSNWSVEELAEKICPKALKTFKEWVNEKWVLLFEIIGYCLYPRYDFNKAIMLVGSGSNGKSTYLRLLRDILGSDNVSAVHLKDLCEDKFAQSLLFGKLANIYADLPKFAIKDTGNFKILTGEDIITADRKFKNRITFRNYAKLVFSTNQLPDVVDMTEAFWRRWLLVEFKNKFSAIPYFYENTFTKEEIEGVIVVAIKSFLNVLRNGKFSFEESEEDYKEFWKRETDSVYAFLQDCFKQGILIKNPVGKENTDDVYNLYTKYCYENEINAVGKNIFSNRMQVNGFVLTRSGNKKFYIGLSINREKASNLLNKYV